MYKDLYKEPEVAEEKSDGTPKKRKAEEEAEDPNTPCTDKARSKKARQTLFQKTIPQVVQEKEPLPFHSTRAQEIHKALSKYLNVDMVPFDAVNSSGFLRLMKIMEPRFEVASHTYYSSQTEVIHERLKSKLIAKVATDNPKQVSVALDGWSENHAGVLDSLELF